MINMTKAILFDNDGILVETEHLYYQATKSVMKEEGFDLSLDLFRNTFLTNNTGAWHYLENINKIISETNNPDIEKIIFSIHLNNSQIIKFYNSTKNFL